MYLFIKGTKTLGSCVESTAQKLNHEGRLQSRARLTCQAYSVKFLCKGRSSDHSLYIMPNVKSLEDKVFSAALILQTQPGDDSSIAQMCLDKTN